MKLKPVLVVEGVSDMNRLINIIDADYVICNGSAVSQETILYIQELSKTRDIIIFTDPDYPGLQIRNKIAQAVPNAHHAYIDRKKASNGKKLGVAECEEQELKRALKDFVTYNVNYTPSLTMEDFIALGLNGSSTSKQKRQLLEEHFHIGYGNAKTTLKRLNMLGITKEKIKEVLSHDSK